MSLASLSNRLFDRRGFFAAGGALGGAALLGACSGGPDESASGGSWSFTDDRGETVELGSRRPRSRRSRDWRPRCTTTASRSPRSSGPRPSATVSRTSRPGGCRSTG